MKVAIFDTHQFERSYFDSLNKEFAFALTYLEVRLNSQTAELARGCEVVCAFANDKLDAATLTHLKAVGVRLIALRSAGFNHVDLAKARDLHLPVVRVPAYSPNAVAEHAIALLLTLNRKTHRAYQRVRELNFSLDGLVGFDLFGKTVGVIGTGRIGSVAARILKGFGCRVLAFDVMPNPALQGVVEYVSLNEIYQKSQVISLHVPLRPETRHMVGREQLAQMQKGVILINTSRGALLDTQALIEFLKSGHLGGAGLDVYEEEEDVFFHDLSGRVLQDDVLARLLTFPNVLVTAHQGFLTEEALHNIVSTTLQNIHAFAMKKPLVNEIRID